MDDYFLAFEDRKPEPPLPYSAVRETLFQFFATLTLLVGGWYILWRWTDSLNPDAMWFALPLVIAETGAFIGMILFVYNMWKDQPIKIIPAPKVLKDTDPDCVEPDRPVAVDVMFATYNEDPELVRLGIIDAKAMRYPHPIDIRIHVLDDGKRDAMRAVCEEEGVGYISRDSNEGFKAGNLRNALEQTSGDFLVICDADTRPFPTFLENTLGYFRDPKMAWVQTPQWFYDLPAGVSLPKVMQRRLGRMGGTMGRYIEKVFGPVKVGEDPFVNDPKMFYDVILRRRNWAHASFCCGAGSVHRREAVMEAALRSFGKNVEARVLSAEEEYTVASKERNVAPELTHAIRREATKDELITPYRFHVSEDIYTSIVLHSDKERGWKSYLHPLVESKMLSPQDLLTWTIQRFKYAGGSLDIMVNDNPLFRPGLKFSHRMLYAATFYSYLGPIWNVIFLAAPIIYLFTGIAPVAAFSDTFFLHIIPFLLLLEITMMIGTWGIAGYASKSNYLSFFPLGLRAIWTVARGKKISFPVTPKDRHEGTFLHLVRPQIAVVVLTLLGSVWAAFQLSYGNTQHELTGVTTNILWGINNCFAMSGMIAAALWKPEPEWREEDAVELEAEEIAT